MTWRRAVAAVVAAAVCLPSAAATAGTTQPTIVIPAGGSYVDVAPQPASTWQGGYHGDCGHGCNWRTVALPVCPVGEVQAVTIVNSAAVDVLVKRYFDPARPVADRGTSTWLTMTAGCVAAGD